MADRTLVSGNDVHLILKRDGDKTGTPDEFGRIVVDSYSLTMEEDDSTESGIGHRQPDGRANGDVTYNWSMDLMGHQTKVLRRVAVTDDSEGGITAVPFEMTSRKFDENGNIEWEYSVVGAKAATQDLLDLESGETAESSLEGDAMRVHRDGSDFA